MRIILVAIHPYPSPQAVPLANAYLKGCLSEATVEVDLLDFFVGQEVALCVDALAAQRPEAIGFSMYVWNRSICLEIARDLSNRLPGLILFAGGPEATADIRGVLSNAPFAFLIVGEGEQAFAEVCCRLSTGMDIVGIPGVAVMKGQELLLSPSVPLADLNEVPSPWLNRVLDTSCYQGILWQLARGCGFTCDFCFDSRGSHGVRRFSLARIEAELRLFATSGVSQVFVLDSTFNQDSQRAKEVLRLIKKNAPRIHFHFEVRSEFIDAEMAGLFARITCSMQIGLQSSNPRVLKEVGRSFNRENFVKKISLLNKTGAVFGFDLMYGLPGDTLVGFCDSIDFALELYPNHLDIFPLAVLPGTVLAARSAAIGLKHLLEPPYTLISSPSFSAEEMAQARRLALACDIFYTRGKAVAWFNGVIASLGLKPSVFLREFGSWLIAERGAEISESDLDDQEIWQLQRCFLKRFFNQRGLKSLLPLALDLVTYHYLYAAALQSPLPVIPGERELRKLKLMKSACHLASSARLAAFHYEILDILDAGPPDVRAFADHFSPSGSWAVIYPSANEIRTESLSEPYYLLLKQLDGHSSAGLIVARLGIPPQEALSFLEFAVADGIIELI